MPRRPRQRFFECVFFVTRRRRLSARARATNRARAGSTHTAAVETGAIRFAIVWHPRGVPLEIYAASESGAGRAKIELQPSSKKESNSAFLY